MIVQSLLSASDLFCYFEVKNNKHVCDSVRAAALQQIVPD